MPSALLSVTVESTFSHQNPCIEERAPLRIRMRDRLLQPLGVRILYPEPPRWRDGDPNLVTAGCRPDLQYPTRYSGDEVPVALAGRELPFEIHPKRRIRRITGSLLIPDNRRAKQERFLDNRPRKGTLEEDRGIERLNLGEEPCTFSGVQPRRNLERTSVVPEPSVAFDTLGSRRIASVDSRSSRVSWCSISSQSIDAYRLGCILVPGETLRRLATSSFLASLWAASRPIPLAPVYRPMEPSRPPLPLFLEA